MRQSEGKYRQVFESLVSAAFLSDRETGRVVDANRQSELLLGRTRAEIIGLNERGFLSPRTFPAFREALAAADSQKSCVEVEVELVRKDGSIIPVNLRAGILLLYGRRLVLGLYRDVTARKQTEEQLQLQGTLLDLVAEAALAVNLEDRIQFWNQSAARLYGWEGAEALGRTSAELLYHDLTEFNAARRTTMQNGEWSGELHQLTRDNHEILVRSRWSVVRDAEGRPKFIVLVNSPAGEKPVNRLKLPRKMAGDFRDFAS
jgi:PAS domain S-box-containing protein